MTVPCAAGSYDTPLSSSDHSFLRSWLSNVLPMFLTYMGYMGKNFQPTLARWLKCKCIDVWHTKCCCFWHLWMQTSPFCSSHSADLPKRNSEQSLPPSHTLIRARLPLPIGNLIMYIDLPPSSKIVMINYLFAYNNPPEKAAASCKRPEKIPELGLFPEHQSAAEHSF